MGFIWDTLIVNPMINVMIVMEQLLFGSFGLAIVAFTILVRVATLPLTLRQLHSSRRMQELTPRIQEIQKKYKDPKRRQEETMKLYREAGVNPLGCLGPMIIQFPIWFALYRVLTLTVGGTPETVAGLSHRLYNVSLIQDAVPLPTTFLWLDLGRQDTTYILVILVGITTWLQTKLSMASATAPQSAQTQQTNKMLLWMMPAMFAWFTLTVPSGLALYWTVTNIIGIVMNYFVYGWHRKDWRDIFRPGQPATDGPRPTRSAPAAAALTDGERATPTSKRPARSGGSDTRTNDEQPGSKRKDRRGGGGPGTPPARSRRVPGGDRDP